MLLLFEHRQLYELTLGYIPAVNVDGYHFAFGNTDVNAVHMSYSEQRIVWQSKIDKSIYAFNHIHSYTKSFNVCIR